jgi:Flp pilus assembly pilin Flp
MSELTSHTQDNFRELCIRADAALRTAGRRLRELQSEDRGQTAAEYMGILLIVALVIAALFASGIDTWIKDGVKSQIDNIKSGSKPGG